MSTTNSDGNVGFVLGCYETINCTVLPEKSDLNQYFRRHPYLENTAYELTFHCVYIIWNLNNNHLKTFIYDFLNK